MPEPDNLSDSPQKIAEVIEASTAAFAAQCYELYAIPPLGSLVKTGGPASEIYAVVSGATTASFDSARRPIARGRDEPNEDAIYKSSPQLLKLLRSAFTALVVGHRQDEQILQYLPPLPARIHGFVYPCSTDEVRRFSGSFGFLNTLLTSKLDISPEECISACLRRMADAQEDRRAFLVAAGRELAALLAGNYAQLRAVLGRLK